MKAYKHLVKFALSNGFTVSVFDGEVWDVKRSDKYQTIINAIESVEIAEIRVRDSEGNSKGWAQIIPFGMADDETISDYTCTDFMESWENSYSK